MSPDSLPKSGPGRRQRGVLLAALFILVASPIVMAWSWETDRVYQCVTRGGTFDYATMRCDPEGGAHPFRSFAERHPRFLMGTAIGGVMALAGGLALSRR